MNKKCLGCGAFLQYDDESKEGYVRSSEKSFCERCFRIKNYGDYKVIVKDNEVFVDILKDINKIDDLVVLVVDLFNIPKDLDIIRKNISNPILLVLTKRDIFAKSIYDDRLLDYMDSFKINFIDKVMVSSNKNYNFDLLLDKIRENKNSDKVYVVGFTNAGKSTLINRLIYNYSDSIIDITTSLLPSTTLNSIEVELDDMVLIDTPGLLIDNSIDNFIDVDLLKKITPKGVIKPISYQIKSKQFIVVENLLKLECSNNNIVMFFANALSIDRFYKDKAIDNLKEYEIEVEKNTDLVISGLGFIKFSKREKVKVYLFEGVNFYIRKALI